MTDTLTLPWSFESERELIGAPFVDPRIVEVISEAVDQSDFYHPAHAQVHAAQLTLWRRDACMDHVLLRALLEDMGVMSVLGENGLAPFLDTQGTTHNVEKYARIVREKAQLRRIIAAATDVTVEAQQGPEDIDAFAASAESRIREASLRGKMVDFQTSQVGPMAAMEAFAEAARSDSAGMAQSLSTGLSGVDNLSRLMLKLCICMGRPAMGKSSLALQIALTVARAGHGVFVWEGEMSDADTWGRMIANLAGVDFRQLRAGRLADREHVIKAGDATQALGDMGVLLDTQTSLTADQLSVRAYRAKRMLEQQGRPMKLVVVDHFHLMQHRIKGSERKDEAMKRSSGILRDLAKDLGACVLLLAQLSRESARRPDGRPRKEDLRECGALEEDAELIIAPFLPWEHDESAQRGPAEVLVVKNRNGPRGAASCWFEGPSMRFIERS